jgi:CitMHS family citrate-Mg2+:H+ or citrate-Ca2+:H+ symporter
MTTLAALGYGIVIVFMVLIMTKRLSPMVGLIVVPIVFAIIGGFGTDIGDFAIKGVKGVASTGAMLIFAIFFFGIMLTAGLFEPLANWVVKKVKGDPLKVLVGTAILATVVSFDGDGATTDMIVCSALIPVYNRLKINKLYLAAFILMPNSIINLIPWGGPTARIQAAIGVDGISLMKPLIPGMVLAILYVIGIAYYYGLKERKRLGVVQIDEASHNEMAAALAAEVDPEEAALKRPKLAWVNGILTVAVIATLIADIFPSAIVFEVGTAIALMLNYRKMKEQKKVIAINADNIVNSILMVLAAGVFMGILTETKMGDAIAQHLISLIPPSLGSHMPIITGLISLPGTYFLSNDAFYYGILPVLAKTGAVYGFTPLQIGVASLMGQAIHMLSPIVASIYLLLTLTDQDLGEWSKFCMPWMLVIFLIYAVTLIGTGFMPL